MPPGSKPAPQLVHCQRGQRCRRRSERQGSRRGIGGLRRRSRGRMDVAKVLRGRFHQCVSPARLRDHCLLKWPSGRADVGGSPTSVWRVTYRRPSPLTLPELIPRVSDLGPDHSEWDDLARKAHPMMDGIGASFVECWTTIRCRRPRRQPLPVWRKNPKRTWCCTASPSCGSLCSVLGNTRTEIFSDQSNSPLLECLGYVATAYGDAFPPFAPPLFHRCIYGNLQESVAAVNNKAWRSSTLPDHRLDLLSAIIQAIDPAKSEALVVVTFVA